MIKYNNSDIKDWNYGDDNIVKVYRNNAVCYYKVITSGGTPQFEVCYAVVDDISQYSSTEFEDVYNKADSRWYKLNNLSQYEEYGVYGSGRTITYYEGKLTVDGDYEYQYSGGSWVNVGEVSGSTATLPNVPFTVNYNAKSYDANTKTLAKTIGQLADTDAVITAGTPTVHNGYLTIQSGTRATISGYQTYFNRNNSNPNMTIISKQKTEGNYCHMFANRDGNYNWMYRCYSNRLTLHGGGETGSISVSTQPVIESVRVSSTTPMLKYNNYTNGTVSNSQYFSYGSTNSGNFALFAGYANSTGEWFVGDFYWVYMSQNTLTDEQVQQVIDYNEGSGEIEYPLYYDEKSAPLNYLTFSSMTEAEDYACENCVYSGMIATIDGSKYVFDPESENGWVNLPYYYKVEDVSPDGVSGWTITHSSTYNPNLSYYDDFSVENDASYSYKYKIAKVTIYGYDSFTYYLRSYGNSDSYIYLTATNLDELESDPSSIISYTDSKAITNTYGFRREPSSEVNLGNYRRITYNNLDKNVEHTFYVSQYCYMNGNSTILIPKVQDDEQWEQVTFSASTNVSNSNKNLYIDSSTNYGGTSWFYSRWMIGLPSGSHTSSTNYTTYDYCGDSTSSAFTSVARASKQIDFTWTYQTEKTLTFRLVDENNNVLNPSDTVYYYFYRINTCDYNYAIITNFPQSISVKNGGRFIFIYSKNRHYIYGYEPNILTGTNYYADSYTTYFDIPYTKLSDEAVTISYTTYDPNDSETPTFSTKVTYPYNNGTTSATTLTSFNVPYTYSYSASQTSDMFTASTYSYTANQASRTITFTVYPNNRTFSTVADMEAYSYAWEGMIAFVNGTKYVYTNGTWVEYASCQYKLCGVCTDGTEITVSRGTTTLTRAEIYAALGQKYLKECVIGDGTVILGEYAFDNANKSNYHSTQYLSSITIADTVTTLQHECFLECYQLTTLTIPSSVTQIDFWAFTRLSGLTEVIFEGTTPPTFTNYMGGVFHDYCPPVIYVPDSAVSAYRAINGYVWTNKTWSSDIIQPISNR